MPSLPGGFDYVETLGRGGMGIVYLAYQRSLARYVALKKISAAWHEHAKARERFLREARAAATLAHPGIVRVLETGEHDSVLWYAMEYVEGGDVALLLQERGGRIPWREAVVLVEKAARAVAHAHASGVAHRDLKPSNLLLDADGNPKLGDFGLAALLGSVGLDLTLTGEIIGTTYYLAPECTRGERSAEDPRLADVYALVAVLFHLLTGRPPFVGETALQVLEQVKSQPAPRVSSLLPKDDGVPAWLENLCAHGLEKDPANRLASAAALADALEQQRDLGSVRKLWSEKSAGWTAAALGLLGLTVSGGAYLALREPKPAPPETAVVTTPTLVAVLPLETPESDSALGVLATGLQAEISATLVRLSVVRVMASASVGAVEARRDFPAFGRLLGATDVLTGSVRREGERLRITIQLADTRTGTLRWTRSYDRRETELFNLQTDVATDVAVQLNAQLWPNRAERSVGASSRVPAAQRHYLDGRAVLADLRQPERGLREAREHFTAAARLDPGFALAWAQLSMTETRTYQWGHDRSETRLEEGLAAAQKALQLNSLLAEAEVALGLYYYRRSLDQENARPHLDRALELAPNHPEVQAALANLERRAGEFQRSAALYRAALDLDPLNGILAYNTADTFVRLRQYATAAEIIERTLTRLPGNVPLTKLKGDNDLLWRGDLTAMRADLAGRKPTEPTPEVYLMHQVDWLLFEGRIEDALAALRASPLQALDGQSIYCTRDGYEAILLELQGAHAEAQAAARRGWEALTVKRAQAPNDPRLLLHAGQLKGILGEREAAEQLIERTLTPGDPGCVDAFDRGFFLTTFAIVLACAQEDEKARTVLRRAMAEPAQLSVHFMNRHPALKRFAADFR